MTASARSWPSTPGERPVAPKASRSSNAGRQPDSVVSVQLLDAEQALARWCSRLLDFSGGTRDRFS